MENVSFDFRLLLESLFENSFVVGQRQYQKLTLDYSVIVTDRLIEVCHVESKAEAVDELATIGRAGKITYHKHKAIRAGTFPTHAFYFLAPSKIITSLEIPKGYGLISYTPAGKLDFKVQADWLEREEDKKYLTRSYYCTLAKELNKQLYSKL